MLLTAEKTRWEEIQKDIRSEVALEGKLEQYKTSLDHVVKICKIGEEPLLDSVGGGNLLILDYLLL
jgi:hypothetical protein